MTHDVTLPSGRVVKIKRPGVLTLYRVYESLPSAIRRPGEQAEPSPLEALRLAIKMVCACAVEPRITEDDPAPAGAVSVDDLEQRDFNALAVAVNQFAAEEGAAIDPLAATATPS